jgi:hypothetical protein
LVQDGLIFISPGSENLPKIPDKNLEVIFNFTFPEARRFVVDVEKIKIDVDGDFIESNKVCVSERGGERLAGFGGVNFSQQDGRRLSIHHLPSFKIS